MKVSEFRKLIREEVRKSISSSRGLSRNKIHEATKPMPLDSSITSQLVFIPYDDVDGLADYAGDEGVLNYCIFVFDGPKTGVIVKKNELKTAIQDIKDYQG